MLFKCIRESLCSSQYAVMAEVLGRGGNIASEAVNCSAPDTGNMGTTVYKGCGNLFSCLYRGISAVWILGATEEMARPSFERGDSFRICHDGKIWWVACCNEVPVAVWGLRTA
jgi:hypothetical protein